MTFRFTGISVEPFRPLFVLSDEELVERGMRRVTATRKPGFPCRVGLADAEPGERLILLPYEHHAADTPYRSSGPIFIRETAGETYDGAAVPPALRSRPLSLRVYDKEGMLIAAEVAAGGALEPALARLFAGEDVAYIHIHNAGQGCYACRVDRG
jgi:hypothetical protein